jgi:hypothetical protein
MDYFEVYYAYLAHCRKVNWANDIDPNHYEMEWHHILPQCLFEDQPCGQWLSLKQHAIASALQTLAFRKKCFCAWHCKHIPSWLWKIANERVCEERAINSRKGGQTCVENKLGIHAEDKELRKEWSKLGGLAVKDQRIGIFNLTPEQNREKSQKAGQTTFERGAGVFSASSEQLAEWTKLQSHEAKVRGGRAVFEAKTGCFSLTREERLEVVNRVNSQRWKCLVTGHISTPAGLSAWQKARGIDTSLRERIE